MHQVLISMNKNKIYISLSEVVQFALLEIFKKENDEFRLIRVLHFNDTDFIAADSGNDADELQIIFSSLDFKFEKILTRTK